MKKNVLFSLLILSNLFVFAQGKVAKEVQQLVKSGTKFEKKNFLNVIENTNNLQINEVLDIYTLVQKDQNVLNEIYNNQYENLEISIPFQNEIIDVQLYKVNIFAEGFQLDTDVQKNVTYQPGVYYRGAIKGDYKSVVTFNFFADEFNGTISNEHLNNLVIAKLDKPNNTDEYIVYSDINLKIFNDFKCGVKYSPEVDVDSNTYSNKNIESNKCVTMYLEVDKNLHTSNGNNLTTTTNWMTSVFNNVKTIYANDGITVAIKNIFVWTSLDPFQGIGTSSSDYLFKFMEERPVFNGDVAQLVGIDPGGLGGVAIGIDGICTSNNHSYADVDFSYSSVPTYSWTINVMTHEFGHLLGSPHTHGCHWNGDETAIDGCGSSQGYIEGDCEQGEFPLNGGTIMSYCHLVAGVGINFNNGFGPQPAARILNKVNNGLCLSTDCVNTCINTVTVVDLIEVSENSASISWSDYENNSSWQVAIYPFDGVPQNWTTVNTNFYTQENLLPNTYYIAAVRPDCSNGLTGGNKNIIFATNADYCNGVVFYDTGGVDGEYLDNQTIYRTMIPNTPGSKIILTFNFFQLELDWDYMYVYNGNSVNAPSFNQSGYTGNTIPGPFISTAADGSLTTKFVSDGGVVDAGWMATVTCDTTSGISEFDGIDFYYFPNPTNDTVTFNSNVNISNIKVYSISGQLLLNNNIEDTHSIISLKDYANGVYFVKIQMDNKEMNIKLVKN